MIGESVSFPLWLEFERKRKSFRNNFGTARNLGASGHRARARWGAFAGWGSFPNNLGVHYDSLLAEVCLYFDPAADAGAGSGSSRAESQAGWYAGQCRPSRSATD